MNNFEIQHQNLSKPILLNEMSIFDELDTLWNIGIILTVLYVSAKLTGLAREILDNLKKDPKTKKALKKAQDLLDREEILQRLSKMTKIDIENTTPEEIKRLEALEKSIEVLLNVEEKSYFTGIRDALKKQMKSKVEKKILKQRKKMVKTVLNQVKRKKTGKKGLEPPKK